MNPHNYIADVDGLVKKLLPEAQYAVPPKGTPEDPTNALSVFDRLPNITHFEFMTGIIKIILEWAMLLTIIALVAAGFIYLTSQGKEETMTKAKSILLYLIIGLAIMASAYAVVIGISQFNFFEAA